MLKIKKITSALISLSVIFAMTCNLLADTRTKDLNPLSGADSMNIEDYYADYDSITFTSKSGHTTRLYLEGGLVGIDSSYATGIRVSVSDERNSIVASSSGSGSISFEAAGRLNVNRLYYIMLVFTADGIQYRYDGIAVTLREDNNLTFVKSVCYDFNIERTSELWTDDASLEECLQPQNDADCTDPVVVSKAQEITAGCTDEWAKSFAIYDYIVNEFAYDYVQIEDDHYIYQDDAASLLLRKIAICEGLGNTFVALCRAAGVPAAVSFGIGASDELVMNHTYTTDESPNHAWACVCLGGTWYHVDPTWDVANSFEGSSRSSGSFNRDDPSYDWYLLPVEYFSLSHKICDADTIHGIEESGSCGPACSYEISRDGTITIFGSGTVKLPEGCNGFRFVVFDDDCTVDTIGESCFSDCDIIRSVVLPDTVTVIEDDAFATCEDLQYIYLPDGLERIGSGAFDYCDELSYIYIPDTVTSVGAWAFDDCPRAIISKPSGLALNESNYYVSPYRIITRRG